MSFSKKRHEALDFFRCVTLHYEIYPCSFRAEGDLRVRTEDLSNLTKIRFISSDYGGSFLLRPLTCYSTAIFLVSGWFFPVFLKVYFSLLTLNVDDLMKSVSSQEPNTLINTNITFVRLTATLGSRSTGLSSSSPLHMGIHIHHWAIKIASLSHRCNDNINI